MAALPRLRNALASTGGIRPIPSRLEYLPCTVILHMTPAQGAYPLPAEQEGSIIVMSRPDLTSLGDVTPLFVSSHATIIFCIDTTMFQSWRISEGI
jgi:hypothetical protein